MKIAIIGAGNMGGALARGLAQGTLVQACDITVADPSTDKLQELTQAYPAICTTGNNAEAIAGADLVIVAVKPWLMETVAGSLPLKRTQVLVSLAAGVSFAQLTQYINPEMTIFRIIPNTGIAERASLTLVSTYNASSEQTGQLIDILNEVGLTMVVDESKIGAGTALSSCGIAFVLKYVQAAMQAGVEMGIPPKDAMKMVAQSLEGAAKLLLNNDTHPSVEIDKVTTPGGITIKGINELEHNGFSSAIIKAVKMSV